MLEERNFDQRMSDCLNEIVDMAKRDGIYDEIIRQYDMKDAMIVLLTDYSEIADRYGI